MPRPGPRPYDCVRRAWHSDRHQPMRGSIIQQVFRLVNEAHSSRTKKNREWQEKLPIVVLKAEEIMYSKANSEAEYIDLETLWDRMNDAVNTIIRKDESNETGEFLQPCIEAALNLGCVPVRASRSQRHSNPRTYLTPRTQDPTPAPPRVFDNPTNEPLTFARSTPMAHNHTPNAPRGFPFLYENLPPHINQSAAMKSNTASSKFGSVYPLYYGTQYQSQEPLSRCHLSQQENTDTIFVGRPIGTSISEPSKKGILKNLFTSDNAELTLNILNEKVPELECDLSLKLGLSSNTFTSKGKNPRGEIINTDLCSSVERENREICFFPTKTGFDTIGSSSSTREETQRKRKIPLSSDNVDQFISRGKWPDL